MVPSELSEKLGWALEVKSPFKPFELGGVLEVDFDKRKKFQKAVKITGKKIVKDLIQELRSYYGYQNFKEIDFDQCALELNVGKTFLKQIITKETERSILYKNISCSLKKNTFNLNYWTKTNLIIKNNTNTSLNNLVVDISGPIKLLPSKIEVAIPRKSKVAIPVAIMPDYAGEFPIEITFFLPKDKLFASFLPFHNIWLKAK